MISEGNGGGFINETFFLFCSVINEITGKARGWKNYGSRRCICYWIPFLYLFLVFIVTMVNDSLSNHIVTVSLFC